MHAVAKPSIVILHGANGTAAIMQPLVDQLRACAEPVALNLLGHGGREVPARVTFELLAADVIAQMDAQHLKRAYLFGFSTGGTLALFLARHFPERFFGVTTLAAKFVFDKRTLAHWMYLTELHRLERTKRAEALAVDHHPQDWKEVTLAIRATFLELEKNPPLSETDLRAISMPALLFFSNEDQIVPAQESAALGRLLPNAKPVMFHGQCHPLAVVPIPAMAKAICNWIADIEKANAASL